MKQHVRHLIPRVLEVAPDEPDLPYELPSPRSVIKKSAIRTPGLADKLVKLRGSGRGKTMWIIANGPSVPRFAPAEPDGDVLLINRPYMPYFDRAKYWAMNDQNIADKFKDQLESFNGTLVLSKSVRSYYRDVIRFHNKSGIGWSDDATDGIFLCRTTSYSSLQFAAYCGYDRINLLGVDMAIDGKQLYFDGSKPVDCAENIRIGRFQAESTGFNHAASILPIEIRRHIHFLTDLNQFPFIKSFGN
jgi:hypothetical protein